MTPLNELLERARELLKLDEARSKGEWVDGSTATLGFDMHVVDENGANWTTHPKRPPYNFNRLDWLKDGPYIEAAPRAFALLREMASECERLEADFRQAEESRATNSELLDEAIAETHALRKRLAACERDAERYQWLRVNGSAQWDDLHPLKLSETEFDAAIDAARKGEAK